MNIVEAVLWLALNLYHEARNEPEIGQLAIVHVVLNRAENRHKTVKEVIQEPYQFSWTLYPKDKYWPRNTTAFLRCVTVVKKGVTQDDFTHGATHYHLNTIHPKWADSLTFVGKWGSHLFYK